jgi:mono/diheme cytochrome c family protein
MKTLSTLAILIGVLGGLAAQPAMAAPNLANGKKIEDTKCYQCHAEKSGLGDGTLIYTRKDRRVLRSLEGDGRTLQYRVAP